MTALLPPSFVRRTVNADGVRINTLVSEGADGTPVSPPSGDATPLLLLHGYPQTHVIWHRVAPMLAAAGHPVVLTDLRGYGDSDKPPSDADHTPYGKRAMARDQLLVMRELGYERFAVVGHDRGGRVGHRLALDHPDAVTALAVLDIVPTRHTFRNADMDFGLGYFHWFFLAAGDGIPEHLIGQDPEFWLRARMGARHSGGTPIAPEAMAEYVRCFADPAAIHASCEDYRAAAGIDLVHDDADAERGHRLACPVLAVWGEHGFVGRHYDVLAAWRPYVTDPARLTGQAVPSDHYVPEEAPERTAELLRGFLAGV